MNIKTIAVLFLAVTVSLAFTMPDGITAQEKVEKAALQWADNTFEFYDGARFENFQEVPTQEAFALATKIETLKEFKVELADGVKKGEIKKTPEQLEKQLGKIDRQIDSLGKLQSKLDPTQHDFEIHLWANIMVSNAVTVYYQHLVHVNGKFDVTSVRITGAVGTQPKGIKILYKKTAKIKANNRPEARN